MIKFFIENIAISMFLMFVGLTLYITYWASKRTNTAKSFYTAGGEITGFQNGLAISGDFMSAASFLGIFFTQIGAKVRLSTIDKCGNKLNC